MTQLIEGFIAEHRFFGHALNDSRAVTKLGEGNLSRSPDVVEPAVQRDGLTIVV